MKLELKPNSETTKESDRLKLKTLMRVNLTYATGSEGHILKGPEERHLRDQG